MNSLMLKRQKKIKNLNNRRSLFSLLITNEEYQITNSQLSILILFYTKFILINVTTILIYSILIKSITLISDISIGYDSTITILGIISLYSIYYTIKIINEKIILPIYYNPLLIISFLITPYSLVGLFSFYSNGVYSISISILSIMYFLFGTTFYYYLSKLYFKK